MPTNIVTDLEVYRRGKGSIYVDAST